MMPVALAGALEQTLRLFREPEKLAETHPLYRMLAKKRPELMAEAEALAAAMGAGVTVEEGTSEMGGGALPGVEIPTARVAVRSDQWSAQEIARRLRCREVPVIGRIQEDAVVLDVRTLLPGESEIVVEAVKEVLRG